MGARKRQLRTELVNAAVAYRKAVTAWKRGRCFSSSRFVEKMREMEGKLFEAIAAFEKCKEPQ